MKHGIGSVGRRFIREIHAGVQTNIDAARHDPEIDVGSHMISKSPAHGPRFDGIEGIDTCLGIETGPTISNKAFIERLVLTIARMSIASAGIRLPEFDQPIQHWGVQTIEYPRLDANALAAGIGVRKDRTEQRLECGDTGILRGETDM